MELSTRPAGQAQYDRGIAQQAHKKVVMQRIVDSGLSQQAQAEHSVSEDAGSAQKAA